MTAFADADQILRLLLAAAIGFVVGFEREWRDAALEKERTFAGARTFAFAGLFGGAVGLIDPGGSIIVAAGLLAAALLAAGDYWARARLAPGAGGTTDLALLATFMLGVLAGRGQGAAAAAGGVLAAVLLALKPWVEDAARKVDAKEITAALRLLAISVVILPILPDQGLGPGGALNPRTIWLIVVVVSVLSFMGYWLSKAFGARGVLLSGVVGGLASSTAATLSLSRRAKAGEIAPASAMAAICAAQVVMFVRIGVIVYALSRPVFWALAPALAAGGLIGVAATAWHARDGEKRSVEAAGASASPLTFATMLSALGLALATSLVVAWRGAVSADSDQGLYALAALAGLVDVDVLTLSVSGQVNAGALDARFAARAVFSAAAANSLFKTIIALTSAGKRTALGVAISFALMLAAAGATLLLADQGTG